MQESSTSRQNYSFKVLSASLKVLSAKNGLTPTQIQRELAKRGVFATPQLIGRLLSSHANASKVGSKWYIVRRWRS